jgi:hypothetical protein
MQFYITVKQGCFYIEIHVMAGLALHVRKISYSARHMMDIYISPWIISERKL